VSGKKLATVDRRPYFEKVLVYGADHGLIDPLKLAAIIIEGAKGTIQVAEYFGTSHLFSALDDARKRIVHLISLYLENRFGDDLRQAANSIQENSFLSHSRGGNELLKDLYAMPDSTIFDSNFIELSLKQFQEVRTLSKPMTALGYQRDLARRRRNATYLATARWFAARMNVPLAALEASAAESVIRIGVLQLYFNEAGCPTRHEFAALISSFRNQANTKRPLALTKTLLANVPSDSLIVADLVRKEIAKHDLPLLLNNTYALEEVLDQLEARYFLRETGLEDIDAFDAFVSKEWSQLTKGKEDPYSRLTLFVCLAAGVKPKNELSVTEGRALIKKVRKNGFDGYAVTNVIQASAPLSIRSDLLSMWDEEFFPELQLHLLDDFDTSYVQAMQFLTENCNIKKSS
jgi:hypothetical protein